LPRQLNGAIYLTYKTLSDEDDLLKLSEDAHKLTYKHMKRADFIEPLEIAREDGTRGLIYFVGGDAASQIQFFVTDTVSHFLRGTLNFNSRPNADSLAPVVRFVADDIEGMLKTLDWQ
jgi:gliding motility-associated lipoprotein GldD